MKKCCFNCENCYCVEPDNFIHVCDKKRCGVEPNQSACDDYEVKDSYKNHITDVR